MTAIKKVVYGLRVCTAIQKHMAMRTGSGQRMATCFKFSRQHSTSTCKGLLSAAGASLNVMEGGKFYSHTTNACSCSCESKILHLGPVSQCQHKVFKQKSAIFDKFGQYITSRNDKDLTNFWRGLLVYRCVTSQVENVEANALWSHYSHYISDSPTLD